MFRATAGIVALLAAAPLLHGQGKKAPVTPKVGQAAPDISGQDIDGHRFKLSDYRGKVVVLDFWGDW
jgi:hypothetical protein